MGLSFPSISDCMNAEKLMDLLEGNQPIKLPIPIPSDKSFLSLQKQKAHGISIVDSDVKSLFPSPKSVETARLARYAVLGSKVEFRNWDFLKALRYLYIVGGAELLKKHGLSR